MDSLLKFLLFFKLFLYYDTIYQLLSTFFNGFIR